MSNTSISCISNQVPRFRPETASMSLANAAVSQEILAPQDIAFAKFARWVWISMHNGESNIANFGRGARYGSKGVTTYTIELMTLDKLGRVRIG